MGITPQWPRGLLPFPQWGNLPSVLLRLSGCIKIRLSSGN